jgi:DnaJ-class molecular chaperone
LANDPYTELGVARGASADEIRKAFRKLAKQHHPDRNQGNKTSEERFKRVTAAFDILGDEEKRKKFDAGEIDADGRESMRGFGGGFGGQGGPFQGGGGYRQSANSAEFENLDLNDLFSEMFGGGRGGARPGAGGFGGGGFGGFGAGGRGQDVRAKLDIDVEEAIGGGRKRIAFSDGRTIEVTIPKGAADGRVLRLKGQGAPGRAGAGDAMIELAIKPHPVFRRDGDNLIMDVPISAPDAVLGGKVTAPTPEGNVTLSVPKGSNSGSMLRLKGRGLPNMRGGRGDLMARLIVTLPDEPDEALERFAESWRKERPYTPRRKL